MHYEVGKWLNRKRPALMRVGDDGVRETLGYFRDQGSAEKFKADFRTPDHLLLGSRPATETSNTSGRPPVRVLG